MFNLIPKAFALSPTPYETYNPYFPFFYGIAIFLAFIVTIGIALFLFVDCLRHKRSFILWPLAAIASGIGLGILPRIFGFGFSSIGGITGLLAPICVLILYLATKDDSSIESNEEGDTMAHGMKRAYFYIFSFITLGILFFGIADLIRVLLEYGSKTSTSYGYGYGYSYQESFTRNVSFRLATIIVTLPIWLFHWTHILGNLKKLQDPHDLRLTFKAHKSYLYLILGLTLITIIVFGIGFVYQILNFILGASTVQLRNFAAPLGYTVTAVAMFVYHYWLLRSKEFDALEERVALLVPASPRTKAAEPVPPPSTAGKFCPKCGAPNATDSMYCIKCGTKLQ